MNKHEKLALERYCENEGSNHNNYHLDETGMRYKNGSLTIAIYPFCHELIKGLDAEMQVKYFDELVDIVCQLSEGVNNLNYKRGAYGPRPITLNSYILTKIHTASVPQILEAYYSALKGE